MGGDRRGVGGGAPLQPRGAEESVRAAYLVIPEGLDDLGDVEQDGVL